MPHYGIASLTAASVATFLYATNELLFGTLHLHTSHRNLRSREFHREDPQSFRLEALDAINEEISDVDDYYPHGIPENLEPREYHLL
jgi:hypothetical protein